MDDDKLVDCLVSNGREEVSEAPQQDEFWVEVSIFVEGFCTGHTVPSEIFPGLGVPLPDHPSFAEKAMDTRKGSKPRSCEEKQPKDRASFFAAVR